MYYAVDTSSFALLFTALADAFSHYTLGQVDLTTVILLAPGLLAGGFAGARLSHRIHADRLRKLFSLLLVLMAIVMILKQICLLLSVSKLFFVIFVVEPFEQYGKDSNFILCYSVYESPCIGHVVLP